MSLRLITPPTTLPVTVEEARANGKIEISEDDAFVEGLIRAALSRAERFTGRAFEPQTWEVTIDLFPDNEIELPFGPVTEVLSVKYTDTLGAEQTMSPIDYVVDLSSADGWVVLVEGVPWPTAMETINAVRVRYKAGDGTDKYPDVKQAILLMVEHWYENRSHGSSDTVKPIPLNAEYMLELHRRQYV